MISKTSLALLEAANESVKAAEALASVLRQILPLAEMGASVGDNKFVGESHRKIEVAKEALERYDR